MVLLILAGITITYVMGDNGIFKKATDAKINTELSKIEEQASMIYSDKVLQKASENSNLKEKPTMQEIVEELRKKGHTIEQVAIGEDEITGISLDKESMTLGFGKTNTIQVILEGPSEPYTYYVLVDGKYYRMNNNNGLITIERTPSDISNDGDGTTQTLRVNSGDETIATAVANNDTNTIDVTSTNKEGTVTITVTYGSYTKTCNVTVAVATEIEINSVRARIATGYTRWLTAIAKPANTSQEFEWTSSNTEIATVDNKGVIIAKKKGTTIITVKTTDGSNLSKTCEVTVDDAVDVTTLTDFQTKNTIAKDVNGNLITVPGNFKVLISEGTKVTDGIVIQDKEENEFVWVPVDSVSTGTSKPADDIRLGRYTFDATNGTPNKEQDAENYLQVTPVERFYTELTSDSENTAAKNLENFVVKTHGNGGYYFGRYEASQGTDGKVDSKFDKTAWINITQPNAATVARVMYSDNYVDSDLINSYSWDTAIVFIQKYSENSNYANKTSVNTNLLNTGKSKDKVCNIYDIASNCYEWTTEHSEYDNRPYNARGGIAGSSNSYSRSRFAPGNIVNSFRAILYLK